MEFDENTYTIKVDGLVSEKLELRIKDLKDEFEQVEVVAALQVCLYTLSVVIMAYLSTVRRKPQKRNGTNQRS